MLTVAKSLPYFILCICLVGFSFGGLLVVFAPHCQKRVRLQVL